MHVNRTVYQGIFKFGMFMAVYITLSKLMHTTQIVKNSCTHCNLLVSPSIWAYFTALNFITQRVLYRVTLVLCLSWLLFFNVFGKYESLRDDILYTYEPLHSSVNCLLPPLMVFSIPCVVNTDPSKSQTIKNCY